MKMKYSSLIILAVSLSMTAAQRAEYLMNPNWKFTLNGSPSTNCTNPNETFPVDYSNQQCMGLTQATASNEQDCINACCGDESCAIWQWCTGGSCSPQNSCWTGSTITGCQAGSGWISRGRTNIPPPNPTNQCNDAWCNPKTDDSAWRVLDLPHDFVVEGNFSQSADKSHGYLPYAKGYYRKHFVVPSTVTNYATVWLDFEGIQTTSEVYLNSNLLGTHASGYTHIRLFVNTSYLNFNGQDNVLAVSADATNPDGWWYDGGGIYRNVFMTYINTPVFLGPWGIYAPSQVTSPITWASNGQPTADATVNPFIEVWSNSSTSTSFSLNVQVVDPNGNVVGTSSGSGSVPAYGNITWSPSSPITLNSASLWHLVYPPLSPSLYTLVTVLTINSVAVDMHNVTFGIRETQWRNDTGFWLNGINTKILGSANHQDFPAVGVAVPDHMQYYRVWKMKEFGGNGWRTAHNPPTPALLYAADELGLLVWDENHRNGQLDQIPLLIRRDRNHPSVVIWSICNEVLCNTNDWVNDALAAKALMHSIDHAGNRPVSANQNGWIGPNTPLDVQGFDYSTTNYDSWHAEAPGIPSISSETSSAVSDRGEYANNETTGHVSGYDNQYPGWGESAEGAWGGVGESKNQGILTRSFISGGWTWTAFDYRGEPTPYGWPDVNSHFGILDLCLFEKDRTYWYKANFPSFNPLPPNMNPVPASYSATTVHILPDTWNWNSGDKIDIWVFANAQEIELIVHGNSLGKQTVTNFSHVEYDAVPFVPGTVHAIAYNNGVAVADTWKNTTGAPVALKASIRDNIGTTLYAGCYGDAALVMVDVVDANGLVVPYANNLITFTTTGPGMFAGTCNGDPADLTNNKVNYRPAYHGKALGVILGPDASGAGSTITVSVSSPGLTGDSINIPVAAPDSTVGHWCHSGPSL